MSAAAFTHCGGCGAAGPAHDPDGAVRCEQCGWRYFLNAATAAAALLWVDETVLMFERARAPSAGLLDLPGGFVDPGESAEQALARELREELQLEIGRACYVGSFPNRYPFGGVTYDVVDLVFETRLLERPAWFATDEARAVHWVDPRTLDPARLAFDSLRGLLATGLEPPPRPS